jgi:hypothetical protein
MKWVRYFNERAEILHIIIRYASFYAYYWSGTINILLKLDLLLLFAAEGFDAVDLAQLDIRR